jgi:hypothetical protein
MAVSNASDIEALNWLMSATHPKPDKRPLKGGEKFGPVTYYVAGIPQGSTNLKLLFADVTPITLRLTELK